MKMFMATPKNHGIKLLERVQCKSKHILEMIINVSAVKTEQGQFHHFLITSTPETRRFVTDQESLNEFNQHITAHQQQLLTASDQAMAVSNASHTNLHSHALKNFNRNHNNPNHVHNTLQQHFNTQSSSSMSSSYSSRNTMSTNYPTVDFNSNYPHPSSQIRVQPS